MRANTLTLGEISALEESGAWIAVVERIEMELQRLDHLIENPDVYTHGLAVGKRCGLRWVKEIPDILRQEAEGNSPYAERKKQ